MHLIFEASGATVDGKQGSTRKCASWLTRLSQPHLTKRTSATKCLLPSCKLLPKTSQLKRKCIPEMAFSSHVPVRLRLADEPPPSPHSSSTSNARLTPDSDSYDSDLDIGTESYELQERGEREKGGVGHDEDDEEDIDRDEGEYHDRGTRRASVSTTRSYQLYTPDEERAVVRKFDRKLVSFVTLLYMLSFLDRSSMLPPSTVW